MGQMDSTQDLAFERLSTLGADGLQNFKKRPRSPDEDETDAVDRDRKRQEVDKAVAKSETGSKPRKSPRQTILEETAKWIANHPQCYSEKFIFFWSASFARGYNSENAWLAQACPAAICIDGVKYRSSYHLYYLEKAGIAERFNLKRKNLLHGEFKGEGIHAGNLVLAVKEHKMNANGLKDLVHDFDWTEEAVQAWDREALYVL